MSNSSTSSKARRGLAAAAAFAVGAVGLFTGGAAAFAENIDLGEIDAARQGSIIVHKFENPGNGKMNPDGTGVAPTSKPIDGVVFEYCSILGVDLFDGTNTGWDTLTGITAADLQAAAPTDVMKLGSLDLDSCTPMPATVDGVSSTGAIALGPYLVREVTAPATVTKMSDPFIVTIPTPSLNGPVDGTGKGDWVYDVNVYPKNDVGDKPTKTIQDQPENGYVVGSKVSYTISQKLPAVENDTYTKLIISDELDTRLSGSEAPVVRVNGTPVDSSAYTYNWTTAAPYTLTVNFTSTGLGALKVGDVVTVDFNAVVAADIGNGVIPNDAFVNVNDLDLDGDGNPGTPTEEVNTRWGSVELKKVDEKSPNTGLTGAEFHVWMSEKASDCRLDSDLVQVKDTVGEPYIAKSGTGGVISIPGLWIGDDEINGGTVNNGLEQRCYVLEEIKAPNGFVLPSGDAAKTEVIVKPGIMAYVQVENDITNTQQGVPELPLTGAAGQALMVAGGVALIAVAAGSVLVARRKQRV